MHARRCADAPCHAALRSAHEYIHPTRKMIGLLSSARGAVCLEVGVAVLVFSVFGLGRIVSGSMQPTLEIGTVVVTNKLARYFQQWSVGDIVTFYPPPECLEFGLSKSTKFVKRIVAVGPCKVEVRDGMLFVDGAIREEDFVREEMQYTFGPEFVPSGHVFVLGDNRNDSFDGSDWGPLPVTSIIGKALWLSKK